MKIKSYSTIFYCLLFVHSMLLLSCETSTLNNDKTFTEDSAKSQTIDFNVKVINEMLAFESRADYDKALEYLGPLNSEEFSNWEEKLGFKSLRQVSSKDELEKKGIVDELLATIINPESLIQIGDNIFKLDVIKEEVTVINASSYSESSSISSKVGATIFSIEDDILDILEGTAEPLSLAAKKRYCEKDKIGRDNAAVRIKVVYQKAGFLNSLQAKISNTHRNGDFPVKLRTNGNNNFWKNKKHSAPIPNWSSIFYDSDEKSYRPYYSSRRLKDYRYSVEFIYSGKSIPEPTSGEVFTLSCSR